MTKHNGFNYDQLNSISKLSHTHKQTLILVYRTSGSVGALRLSSVSCFPAPSAPFKRFALLSPSLASLTPSFLENIRVACVSISSSGVLVSPRPCLTPSPLRNEWLGVLHFRSPPCPASQYAFLGCVSNAFSREGLFASLACLYIYT